MVSMELSPRNKQKTVEAHKVLADLLGQVLKKEYHGSASIEIVIHEGSIQGITGRTEQKHR